MTDDLVFGWRTALLLVAFIQLLLIAAALTRPLENRASNRTLAALLVVLAGIVTPWMIGFAGFYDRWRWLSFVPVSITLAVAPLFWLYVHALLKGHWPDRAKRHLFPALAQFAYLAICFLALPLPLKNEWLARQGPAYQLITGLGVMAGLTGYGLAIARMITRYRAELPQQVADAERYALGWLGQAMAALFVLLAVWTIFGVWDFVAPLGYRGLMGLYVAIAAIALFLGVQGLRHADRRFPMPEVPPTDNQTRDWAALGQAWAATTRNQRWHTDPDLSLALLARRLGTNTGYLSRALNEGLGMNFATFVGRLRCETVADAIAAGRSDDLLDLALEAGFSSKASFNRAFRAEYGCTPSTYRQRHVSKGE
ncbi:helix-turn-helix domain-containing protein [Porphyrobacter sp. YT40]|uniref:helix-turn-helix domain-containing protein n=1 Tax=Porphyrobacter sp. YT40 TaxID=2547601 RepID=UPI001141FCD6|nr:helix-turn-helix domain-containing protein [Porphyrobacter sp. YT40]QDH35051.1 AraC family transcriptional regulator [Porphyrobacter sp. YT40]